MAAIVHYPLTTGYNSRNICFECQLQFCDLRSYVLHLKCEDHIKNALELKSKEKFQEAVRRLSAFTTSGYDDLNILPCKLCNMKLRTYNDYYFHINSSKHKDIVQKFTVFVILNNKNGLPKSYLDLGYDNFTAEVIYIDPYGTPTFEFRCKVCSRTLICPHRLIHHLYDNAHKDVLRSMKSATKEEKKRREKKRPVWRRKFSRPATMWESLVWY